MGGCFSCFGKDAALSAHLGIDSEGIAGMKARILPVASAQVE